VPYRYLPGIAISDIAFEASGGTLEELFSSAGDALTNVMVDDLSTIEAEEKLGVNLSGGEIDLLLFDFLQEFIFQKDAKLLLLRVAELTISRVGGVHILNAVLYGEHINPLKHPMKVDVKAVTLHRFAVLETPRGWKATVVLDV
jgi:SHS2 domain-containing protein